MFKYKFLYYLTNIVALFSFFSAGYSANTRNTAGVIFDLVCCVVLLMVNQETKHTIQLIEKEEKSWKENE